MHLPICLQDPASSPLTFMSPHPTAVEVSLPSSPSGNPQSSPLGPAPSRTISTSCLPEPLAPPHPPCLRSRTNSCGAEAAWACGWRAPCGLAGVSRAWPATVTEAGRLGEPRGACGPGARAGLGAGARVRVRGKGMWGRSPPSFRGSSLHAGPKACPGGQGMKYRAGRGERQRECLGGVCRLQGCVIRAGSRVSVDGGGEGQWV